MLLLAEWFRGAAPPQFCGTTQRYTHVSKEHLFDTHGNATQTSGRISTDFRYAGMFYEQNSGLYLTEYRAYSPRTARWLTRDPLRGAEFSQGINLYAYVANSFINLIDPAGTSWLSAVGYFVAGVAVGVAVTAVVIAHAPEIAAVATAGLIAAGASEVTTAAVVTGTAGVLGAVGGASAIVNTGLAIDNALQTGNWDQAAFDVGSIVGAGGYVVGSGAMSGWSLSKDLSMGYQPYFDPEATLGETL